MTEERKFEPAFLFHKDGRREKVENQDIYEMLLKTKEWATSPAEWGVITAPNKEQAFAMELAAQATPPNPTLVVTQRAREMEDLQTRVAACERDIASLHQSFQGMSTRMAELQQQAQPEAQRKEPAAPPVAKPAEDDKHHEAPADKGRGGRA